MSIGVTADHLALPSRERSCVPPLPHPQNGLWGGGVGDRRTVAAPVLVIGKGRRKGRISFGPGVVVAGVAAELQAIDPTLAVHLEPRQVGGILHHLVRPRTRIIHFLSTGYWSLVAPVIRLLLRKTIITTFHGYVPLPAVYGTSARFRHRVSILQARIGMAASDTIVPVSGQLVSQIRSIAPAARIRVIPNGLSGVFSTDAAAGSQRSRSLSSRLRLLIVGFGRHKGIEGTLEALGTLHAGSPGDPPWTLTVVGLTPSARPYRRMLEARFPNLRDRVSFLDAVPHDLMPSLYREHDVLLLWSSHESFGLVVLEAMACGVVPVVSDRVGVRNLIVHGSNGFVIPMGDTAALAETIRQIQCGTARIDFDLMRRTAAAADMRRSAEGYRELYRELLGR